MTASYFALQLPALFVETTGLPSFSGTHSFVADSLANAPATHSTAAISANPTKPKPTRLIATPSSDSVAAAPGGAAPALESYACAVSIGSLLLIAERAPRQRAVRHFRPLLRSVTLARDA